MHLTLRFVGDDVSPTAFDALKKSLSGIKASPFEIHLRGVGRFPPKGTPRVLWAGVADSPALRALADRIEYAVRAAGVPAEKRPFSAHITAARLSEGGTVDGWLNTHAGFASAPIPVSAFILYSSVLAPAGSTYRREAVYPLLAES
jgi:2'-5' RNA ligase